MIMKSLSILLLTLSLYTHSANTIIAVLNNDIITLSQLNKVVKPNDSKKQKMRALQSMITEKVELEYIKKLRIIPTNNAIENELRKITEQNNISINDLKELSNYQEILSLIVTNLSKIALRQVIVQKESKKSISASSSEGISIYQEWLQKIKSKMFIEIFEYKI